MKTVCCILALCLLCACGEEKPSKTQRPPALVGVVSVERQDLERRLHLVGNVQASATVDVKTRVTGELVGVHFKEGDDLAQGQVIFTIDSRPFQATLREAQAGLARDLAQLAKAEEDMRRYGKLVQGGYVSREAYDKAVTDAASLRATVLADRATVESAALQLTYCAITAPIAGRAGSLKADRGNMIKANDTEPLLTIDTLEPVYVTFAVPEVHLATIQAMLRRGPVAVTAVPGGGQAAQGQVDFLENSVDTRTGTIRLRATFDNGDRALWPGSFVQVRLPLGLARDAVTVPSRAVQAGHNESYVYVVDADGRAQYRKIQVDFDLDGRTAIAAGLEPGETVVMEGQIRLAPGVPVKIR